MSETNQDTCPKCGGPCEREGARPRFMYRSTAAEQLVHVKTISQSMAEENDKLHHQLADKERELATAENLLRMADGLLTTKTHELAAANTVVEAGDAFRNCPNSEEVVKRMTEFFKVLAEYKLKRRG